MITKCENCIKRDVCAIREKAEPIMQKQNRDCAHFSRPYVIDIGDRMDHKHPAAPIDKDMFK